ncbi:MAG: hypothetical protein CO034_00175 [Parcubacteria group bacterium CG_4_9_14_0_2_um_filter_35_11]|nr:MAG: hypothetical protein CO034_00175 [Parcubacteria group bacterium CG_4_9_14_0_2_um_filter_35_11]
MKIGFVSAHTFSSPGGVKKHTLALKREFEARGHQVKLILPRDTIEESQSLLYRKRQEEIFFQKGDRKTIFFGGALYIPGNASKTNLSLNITPLSIWMRLKKENFDILHFQNFGVFLPIQILEAASQLPNPPLKILTLHALWEASLILQEFPPIPTLITIFKDYILPRFDGVIGVSAPVLSQIEYKGAQEIIPNGVDLNFFNPKGEKIGKFDRSRWHNDRRKVINILFVGRIEKRKGLIYLLKAFEILRKKYQNIRLIVVGEGEKRGEMEDFVKENNILDVFFEGEIQEKDLPKYYRTADICCFPSIYGEAFGIVLLEAMASARPIVAFANRGYKEVLVGKGSNFLVKPKDIGGLVKKLEILIQSKETRKEIGSWGREEAEKYSWSKIAQRTLNFYDKVIKLKD